MVRRGCLASLVCLLAVSACGGGSNPPGGSDPPGGDAGDRITGNERLGWNQVADNAGELNRMQFAAYVDGNRVDLVGAACTGSTSPFTCSSRMPSMTPGAHTIELASYVMDGGDRVESGRSAPLRVTVVAATAGAGPSNPTASQQTTSDGVALRLDSVATDLHGVTAMAFSSDGLLIIGERRGRILIESVAATPAGASLASNPPAIELHDVHLPAPDVGGLLALALDPAFERTRFVYALYTIEARDGVPGFRVARFREASRQLGERAVLLENLPASPERPAGALAFGADGKLYVTFDDGGDPSQSARASSYSGKLLRLNADGTTPQDQAGRPPVVESDLRSPRGFDWHPGSGALWLADTNGNRDALRVRGASTRSRPAQREVMALPQGTDASSVAFAKGTLMPILHGDLFVASRQGRHLLRLRIDRRDANRVVATERLFADVAGPVNTVASGADGALYLGTDTAVLRISPR
jgi:glucose/arabinose dehydrogenase